MATLHITEAEAAHDLTALLARVRQGTDIVIDDASSAIRLSMVPLRRGRLLSESIALTGTSYDESGSEPIMDPAFAADVEEIVRSRKPRDTSAWD